MPRTDPRCSGVSCGRSEGEASAARALRAAAALSDKDICDGSVCGCCVALLGVCVACPNRAIVTMTK